MKYVSWSIQSEIKRGPFLDFFMTPYLSVRSLNFLPGRKRRHLSEFLIYTIMTVIFIIFAREFLVPLSNIEVMLLSPFILFFTEAMGAFGQILFSFNPVPTYPIHHNPLGSRSLSEFWGKRWNLWIQDWLRDVSSSFNQPSGSKKLLISFCFSGIFHEVMCNLPYWLIYKKSYFGSMMGYFLIQGLGLWFDKKFLKNNSVLVSRVFLWLIVIVPSPLFINVPLLTFFGLNYE